MNEISKNIDIATTSLQSHDPVTTIDHEGNEKRLTDYPDIPGYHIDCKIAKGGMGVVYKATQTELGRTVALKVILAGQHASETERARFVNEARAVALLDHDNIVRIYEIGNAGNTPYLALEYVGNGTLEEQLCNASKDFHNIISTMLMIVSGMQAAHLAGIIHRDLKPANILITENGTPKIADFGLAKIQDIDLTATGAILGTPAYMSPEQAFGESRHIGPTSDVYSVGAILYRMLTGRPPVVGKSIAELLDNIKNSQIAHPRTAVKKSHPELSDICMKCLDREPGCRYASMQQLYLDIQKVQLGETPNASKKSFVGMIARYATHPVWISYISTTIQYLATILFIIAGITLVPYMDGSAYANIKEYLYLSHNESYGYDIITIEDTSWSYSSEKSNPWLTTHFQYHIPMSPIPYAAVNAKKMEEKYLLRARAYALIGLLPIKFLGPGIIVRLPMKYRISNIAEAQLLVCILAVGSFILFLTFRRYGKLIAQWNGKAIHSLAITLMLFSIYIVYLWYNNRLEDDYYTSIILYVYAMIYIPLFLFSILMLVVFYRHRKQFE